MWRLGDIDFKSSPNHNKNNIFPSVESKCLKKFNLERSLKALKSRTKDEKSVETSDIFYWLPTTYFRRSQECKDFMANSKTQKNHSKVPLQSYVKLLKFEDFNLKCVFHIYKLCQTEWLF